MSGPYEMSIQVALGVLCAVAAAERHDASYAVRELERDFPNLQWRIDERTITARDPESGAHCAAARY